MKRLDQRTLLNLGRKAGLNTRELYSAMSGGRFPLQDMMSAGTDGNGFITQINNAGQPIYRPDRNGRHD